MNKELSGIVKSLEAKFKKTQASAKKKANSIFTAMSVAHVDDDDDILNPGQVYHVDKFFPNGDVYMGQWADNAPNGHGKSLWVDGCMYVGDWSKGKTNGKGKFSWPSGATYEGQFRNGYMDGEGTYTGSTNDVYKGSWVFNMKHGKGIRHYPNGDYYEGQWRRGRLDGKGRYQWSNGNQYIGHWRHGRMNGNGTMIWFSGSRYDGCWEEGLPKGNGTFRWEDGSFYVGVWSKDPKEQSGTYYPSGVQTASFDWNPQELYLVNLGECRVSSGEKITVFPSQKTVNWSCEAKSLQKQSAWKNYKDIDARLRRASTDGTLGSSGISVGSASDLSLDGSSDYLGSAREADSCIRGDGLGDSRGNRGPHMIIKPPKKQGITIAKGHKNYELMLNLQLGIRHSVGRPAPATSLDLKASAFDPRDKIWTRFPPDGSKHTPPHQSCEFRWKDYCPLVFRTLRKLFKVDSADYMISICGNDALRELSSPGKSGSFFYLTNDDKYMIKTMKKSEVKVLKRMLPAYYNHVRSYENTLVTKFFGLHCVKVTGHAQKKVRFVIMGNLFCTEYPIHRRFDLKGSSHGRLTEKPESEIEATTTLKDLDLNFIFRLQKSWFQQFCWNYLAHKHFLDMHRKKFGVEFFNQRQVDKDCEFLAQERIMDYSLLVGIHFREVSQSGEPLNTNSRAPSPTGKANQSSEAGTPGLSRSSIRLGSNMPIRAELTVRRNKADPQLVGEPTGEFYDVVLVFGVIDILQDYDISKKLEHAYKAFQYDSTSISAVDPRLYSKRFRDFIFKIFTEDG